MLDLLYDIRKNGPTFAAMQEFLRLLRDHPTAEYHALDTGHFALEDKADEIAAIMREFLPGALQPA